MNVDACPVVPGSVVTIDENDYMYGLGRLRLRVGHVTALRSEPGWALVAGVQIDHQGIERDRRDVVVRISALREAVRHCS